VELLVYQGLTIYTQTAQIVQANLKEVGINAEIKLLEWATQVDRKNKGDFDFLIWGVNIKLQDPDVYSYYFGSQSTYWAKPIGFVDERIEALLEKGRKTTDTEKRKQIYHELEKRILELSPWVFINWRDQAQAYVDKIKGHVQLGGALSESGPGISMKTMWVSE
jgi:ABC-type transport system substrate-binding protein